MLSETLIFRPIFLEQLRLATGKKTGRHLSCIEIRRCSRISHAHAYPVISCPLVATRSRIGSCFQQFGVSSLNRNLLFADCVLFTVIRMTNCKSNVAGLSQRRLGRNRVEPADVGRRRRIVVVVVGYTSGIIHGDLSQNCSPSIRP